MQSEFRFHHRPFSRAAGWAVRAVVALALLLGVAVLAGRAGPAPVSAQAGAISVNVSASPNPAAIGQPVTISFSATPPAVTPPQPTITSFTINFGDGQVVSTTGSNSSTIHTYDTANVYNVTVTAMDSIGGSNSASTQVQVLALTPPQVQLVPALQTAQVGETVSFNYAVSVLNTIGITTPLPTATISFGDGTSQQLAAASGTITHVYSTAGNYTVTLSASFPGGQVNTTSATVSVGSATPPTVTVTATPASIQPGQSVTFNYSITPSSANVTIRSATIDFGDGQTQQLASASGSVSHTYTTQGTYLVKITATDSNGQTGQGTASVTVAPPSVSGQQLSNVQFVSPPTTGTAGQPVSFTVATATTPNSGATITSYSINFGDNSAPVTATPGQPVTHTYSAAGAYTVTLTVTDSTGVSTTASGPIVISSAGLPVSYAAGWNLVGGPTGTVVTGNAGPLYTFQPGDTAYEVVQSGTALKAGQGYWAYFPTATTSGVPLTTPQTVTVQAPAGQFFQIGNPGDTNATVSGADVVDAFDPTANSYVQTTTLRPGQAAWVFSAAGGTITITNAAQ